MGKSYSMDFKTKPFKHQRAVFMKAKDKNEYALFWQMGLGKTKTIIDLIRYKFYKHGLGNVLIVCPKIVTYTWLEQIAIHSYMEDMAIILKGKEQRRFEDLYNPFKNIFIINYEGLLVMEHELLQKEWMIIVADEGHRIKNHKSLRGKIICNISAKTPIKYMATGTPMLKNYMDFFNEFKFLDNGQTFGNSFSSYKRKYFTNLNAEWKDKESYFPKWEVDKYMLDDLHSKIFKKADRRLKKDCLDLPDETQEIIYVKMSKEQNKVYKELRDELIHWVDDNEAVTVMNALTKTLRLAQVTSGFIKTTEGREVSFKTNPKIDALGELLEDLVEENKVVISAAFIHDIKLIGETFKKYNPAFVYGKSDHQKEKKKFVEDEACRILIAHPHSLIGINDLVVSNYIIYFSNNNSYEDRHQSRERINRPGQKKNCTYIDIVAGPVDKLIIENLDGKEDMSKNILDQIRAGDI